MLWVLRIFTKCAPHTLVPACMAAAIKEPIPYPDK